MSIEVVCLQAFWTAFDAITVFAITPVWILMNYFSMVGLQRERGLNHKSSRYDE
jgi:hypothetical protein